MAETHTFQDLAEVVIAGYCGRDPSYCNRLRFWIDQFNLRPISSITSDVIEDAIDVLIARGKLKSLTTRDPLNTLKSNFFIQQQF